MQTVKSELDMGDNKLMKRTVTNPSFPLRRVFLHESRLSWCSGVETGNSQYKRQLKRAIENRRQKSKGTTPFPPPPNDLAFVWVGGLPSYSDIWRSGLGIEIYYQSRLGVTDCCSCYLLLSSSFAAFSENATRAPGQRCKGRGEALLATEIWHSAA